MATLAANAMNTITFDNQVNQLSQPNNFLNQEVDFLPLVQEQMLEITRGFIGLCQMVVAAKPVKGDTNRQYAKTWKEGIEGLGWLSSTIAPYAKVGSYLIGIEEYNLELLDINTIKAICCDKFQPIIERLKEERLTVVEVREEMLDINRAIREAKKADPPPVFKWEKNKFGQDRLVIFLEDADAGRDFVRQLRESQKPLPLFFREVMRRPKVEDLITPVADDIQQIVKEEVVAPLTPTYRVRQIGVEDYIWIEGCTLVKNPNPPQSHWYIFKAPDDQIIRVVGEEEFEIIPMGNASG